MFIISALGRLRQDDLKFGASLVYIPGHCLKETDNIKTRNDYRRETLSQNTKIKVNKIERAKLN